MKRLVSVTVGTHGWTHLLLVLGLLGAIGYSLYNSTVAFAQGQRGLHQTACKPSDSLTGPGIRAELCFHLLSVYPDDSRVAYASLDGPLPRMLHAFPLCYSTSCGPITRGIA